MISLSLQEIERSIRTLSLEEKLWLLERIARQVREKQQTANLFANEKYMQQQLRAMASDPDIIVEIAAINDEFAVTEMDGLEKV
ncbi:hypothetical protein WA1_20490 [Scytonema hofmannii PCC 7110]|uniref:Uncharacterized protein n=2 Tax=Scytonema hofmannii TaxID=34078 RepID=A0A139XD66_9CYAN|nr:hypothetical protein WA1_20490 [Scytonema hofmannii PCC 7110]